MGDPLPKLCPTVPTSNQHGRCYKNKNSPAFAALREKIIANELAINQNENI
jgi:hypothetical protein